MFFWNWLLGTTDQNETIEPHPSFQPQTSPSPHEVLPSLEPLPPCPCPCTSLPPPKIEQGQGIHILTDAQFTLIMNRIQHLEKLLDEKTKKEQPKSQDLVQQRHVRVEPNSFQIELGKRLEQLRTNMGESHGFTTDEIKTLNILEESLMS